MLEKNVDNPDQANSIDPIESANDSRPKDEEARGIITAFFKRQEKGLPIPGKSVLRGMQTVMHRIMVRKYHRIDRPGGGMHHAIPMPTVRGKSTAGRKTLKGKQ